MIEKEGLHTTHFRKKEMMNNSMLIISKYQLTTKLDSLCLV